MRKEASFPLNKLELMPLPVCDLKRATLDNWNGSEDPGVLTPSPTRIIVPACSAGIELQGAPVKGTPVCSVGISAATTPRMDAILFARIVPCAADKPSAT